MPAGTACERAAKAHGYKKDLVMTKIVILILSAAYM